MSANELYWTYNLPLQVSPAGDGHGEQILNYMPRKNRCEFIDLSEVLGEQTREEFYSTAADMLENLARLMRVAAADPSFMVYYHDEEVPTANRGQK